MSMTFIRATEWVSPRGVGIELVQTGRATGQPVQDGQVVARGARGHASKTEVIPAFLDLVLEL